jgi:spermidine synthase
MPNTNKLNTETVSRPNFHRIGIYITVFLTGAAIMVIELLGTRIIAPFYGASLYVWSSLISVTMIALALGYYIGGRASDSRLNIRLSWIIVSGALLILMIPWWAKPVLIFSDPLGLRAGAFFSALVLFTPSLTMLGMIGPVAIKLATSELTGIGTSVGSIYAVSTIGSVLGTLLLGFLLFPLVGSREILIGLGLILLLLSWFMVLFEKHVLRQQTKLWPCQLITLFAILLIPTIVSSGKFGASDKGFKLQSEQESLYGWVRVIDQPARDLRILTSDSSAIGASSIKSGMSRLLYQDIVGLIPALQSSMKRALIIGLGAGHMAGILQHGYGMTVDTLEIDPSVSSAAKNYFGYQATDNAIIGDARYEIRKLKGSYDLIIHDCFTGGSEPAHLLTVEALEQIRKLLSPTGILAVNFVGFSSAPNNQALMSVRKTIAQILPQQKIFISEPGKDFNDFIFLAAETLPEFKSSRLSTDQQSWLNSRFVTLNNDAETILTDNFNPLEHMQIAKSEHYRRFILDWLGPELLLR